MAPEKVAERTRLGLRKSTVTERATQWLIVRSSVLVLLAGIVVVLFVLLAWRLRATLLLVALGLFIAALLNPFVRMLHRRGMRRGYAVGVVYAVLVLLALAFGYLVFHPLITNATHFAVDSAEARRSSTQGQRRHRPLDREAPLGDVDTQACAFVAKRAHEAVEAGVLGWKDRPLWRREPGDDRVHLVLRLVGRPEEPRRWA